MPKKPYKGASNDKERSMQKLVDAVGTIIRTKGYTGLGPTNIAKCAGLSKRLIYFYFGTVDKLVETYVRGKDYWVATSGNAGDLMETKKGDDTREILEALLLNQFDYFFNEEEMQKIVLWQLSERSQIMYEVCEERERLGSEFFDLADPYFENTSVDLRAVAGLLVGGIYYMILHSKSNDSLFCQIDVNSPEGAARIKKAVSEILLDTYKRAEKQRRN
ncbi:TetR/AcrR family transcriptional regulator [Mucilaginibacter ginsenosidivorax]|uniref:TetR/AcrR family transcriptional regulator n=1 Tax=Mucilaginibacter ginsenosidivorax TaxID=862126 RepID=A0A5B8W4S9_9SPHI|nr:TetR/AcrR family transcriptional regulator [Mucilaginibacter ginsenosidivorax]QEC78864.1 TetR/AcrR family transcriptional regulator [Mucilaginibacter ginsenosidivorax]